MDSTPPPTPTALGRSASVLTPATVVVRVWLPDRPGALGAVASRIGAVRGDVIAIDVLERGGGRAVDELTVSLADEELIDLLVAEIGQVDGVDVEDVRRHSDTTVDRGVAALRAATKVAMVPDPQLVHQVFCEEANTLLGADWVAVLDAGAAELVASAGSEPPPPGWLAAFILGVAGGAAEDGSDGSGSIDQRGAVDELAFCRLDGPDDWAVLSRGRLPLRAVEREVLEELSWLASQRRLELAAS